MISVSSCLCGQYHLAVAGGCEAFSSTIKKSFAPTRYREVVLTASKLRNMRIRLFPRLKRDEYARMDRSDGGDLNAGSVHGS